MLTGTALEDEKQTTLKKKHIVLMSHIEKGQSNFFVIPNPILP